MTTEDGKPKLEIIKCDNSAFHQELRAAAFGPIEELRRLVARLKHRGTLFLVGRSTIGTKKDR